MPMLEISLSKLPDKITNGTCIKNINLPQLFQKIINIIHFDKYKNYCRIATDFEIAHIFINILFIIQNNIKIVKA